MKKIFMALMLSLISIASFGQVTVQKSQKTGEIVLRSGNGFIFHDLETDIYALGVTSTNQFEDKMVIIPLGTGKEETIESIKAIESMWEESNNDDVFEIDGIKCTVYKGMVMYLQFANPPYSAGSYYIECEFNTKLGLFDKALKRYKKGKF